MIRSRNFTPYILAAFFVTILLALIGAQAWSHEQAVAAQAEVTDTTDIYVATDDEAPVTDAVVVKAAS